MRKSGLAIMVAGVVSLTCTAAIATSLAMTPQSGAGAGASPAPASSVGTANEPEGLKDAKASDCFACHAIDHKIVGPAYDAVAKRYAGQGDAAVDKLVEKVIKGGSGNWGTIPMTAHPGLGEDKTRTIVKWILSLKPAAAETARAKPAKTYAYKLADGKSVTLDFPLFMPGSTTKVTDDVFTGYEQFNAYCNRCHGDDAVGGAYAAPDLRHSIKGGLTHQQFLDIALAGREAKGMPSWAGFFTSGQIQAIWEYVKGRELGLVPAGRPPSSQD